MFTDNSGISLISDTLCHKSHSIRIIVREKDIISKDGFEDRVKYFSTEQIPEQYLLEGGLPRFEDREVAINNASVIAEYLDDRYPHPPLLPVYPIDKVKCRAVIHKIAIEWSPIIARLMNNEATEQERKEFGDTIITFSRYFEEKPYFITDDFSLADAFLIPILWRLGEMRILISQHRKTQGLLSYMRRMFERPSIKESFSDLEKEFVDPLISANRDIDNG